MVLNCHSDSISMSVEVIPFNRWVPQKMVRYLAVTTWIKKQINLSWMLRVIKTAAHVSLTQGLKKAVFSGDLQSLKQPVKQGPRHLWARSHSGEDFYIIQV